MLDILFKTDVGLFTLAAFTAVVSSGFVALFMAWKMVRGEVQEEEVQ